MAPPSQTQLKNWQVFRSGCRCPPRMAQVGSGPERRTRVTIEMRSESRREGELVMNSGQLRRVEADDGATLAYVVLGEGPDTLVFLHGWGGAGSRSSWIDPLGYLGTSGLRIILMDQRGHGE